MKRGLSGSALKWIAIVTMLVDHLGACLIEGTVMNAHGHSPYLGYYSMAYDQAMFWYRLDYVLRCIGRVSFPIFCFLLVEGFLHTRNVKKYALRLGVFCLLSEIPFDLAFQGVVFDWGHQNVFFTLFLAVLGLWGMEELGRRGKQILGVFCILGAALAAEVLRTDYGAFGVELIAVLYFLRSRKLIMALCGAVLVMLNGSLEAWGALAFLPILLYSGERGRQPKYFFYAFYPLHLLVLAAAGYWILPLFL